jgi:hypothetical protein
MGSRHSGRKGLCALLSCSVRSFSRERLLVQTKPEPSPSINERSTESMRQRITVMRARRDAQSL